MEVRKAGNGMIPRLFLCQPLHYAAQCMRRQDVGKHARIHAAKQPPIAHLVCRQVHADAAVDVGAGHLHLSCVKLGVHCGQYGIAGRQAQEEVVG